MVLSHGDQQDDEFDEYVPPASSSSSSAGLTVPAAASMVAPRTPLRMPNFSASLHSASPGAPLARTPGVGTPGGAPNESEAATVSMLMAQMQKLMRVAELSATIDEDQAQAVLASLRQEGAVVTPMLTPARTPGVARSIFGSGGTPASRPAFGSAFSSSVASTISHSSFAAALRFPPSLASSPARRHGGQEYDDEDVPTIDSLDAALQHVLAERDQQLLALQSEFGLEDDQQTQMEDTHASILTCPDESEIVPQMLHGATHLGPPGAHSRLSSPARPSRAAAFLSSPSLASTATIPSPYSAAFSSPSSSEEISRLTEEVSLASAQKQVLEERIVALTQLFVMQSGIDAEEAEEAHHAREVEEEKSSQLFEWTLSRLEASEASLDSAHALLEQMRHDLVEKETRLDQLHMEARTAERLHAHALREARTLHEQQLQLADAQLVERDEAQANLRAELETAVQKAERLELEKEEEAARYQLALEEVTAQAAAEETAVIDEAWENGRQYGHDQAQADLVTARAAALAAKKASDAAYIQFELALTEKLAERTSQLEALEAHAQHQASSNAESVLLARDAGADEGYARAREEADALIVELQKRAIEADAALVKAQDAVKRAELRAQKIIGDLRTQLAQAETKRLAEAARHEEELEQERAQAQEAAELAAAEIAASAEAAPLNAQELSKVSEQLERLSQALSAADDRIEYLTGELARQIEAAESDDASSEPDHALQITRLRESIDTMREAWSTAVDQLAEARAEHEEREGMWARREASWCEEKGELQQVLREKEDRIRELTAEAAEAASSSLALSAVTPARELARLHQHVELLQAQLERTEIRLRGKESEVTTLTRQVGDLRAELSDPTAVRMLSGSSSEWSVTEMLFGVQLVAVAIFAAVNGPWIADLFSDNLYG